MLGRVAASVGFASGASPLEVGTLSVETVSDIRVWVLTGLLHTNGVVVSGVVLALVETALEARKHWAKNLNGDGTHSPVGRMLFTEPVWRKVVSHQSTRIAAVDTNANCQPQITAINIEFG